MQPSDGSTKYKVELCRSFKTGKECNYGIKCQYAHALQELNPIKVPLEWKTEKCNKIANNLPCNYTDRCNFLHPGDRFSCVLKEGYILLVALHRKTDERIVRIVEFFEIPQGTVIRPLEINDWSQVFPDTPKLVNFFKTKSCVYSENTFSQNSVDADPNYLYCPFQHTTHTTQSIFHRYPYL